MIFESLFCVKICFSSYKTDTWATTCPKALILFQPFNTLSGIRFQYLVYQINPKEYPIIESVSGDHNISLLAAWEEGPHEFHSRGFFWYSQKNTKNIICTQWSFTTIHSVFFLLMCCIKNIYLNIFTYIYIYLYIRPTADWTLEKLAKL